MITKVEYFMNNIFGEDTKYNIEKIDNDYYFNSKNIENKKMNYEETKSFIEKLLISLDSYKKNNEIIITDEPVGYIKIIKDSGEIITYSSMHYMLGRLEELLRQFEQKVMIMELE